MLAKGSLPRKRRRLYHRFANNCTYFAMAIAYFGYSALEGMAEWMILLFFIPLVNFVIGIMMWAKICIARQKSPWLVVLFFIPVVDLIFLPYLAFSD
jgi:uncharacterized membrane protein YhaH (DUF805 family)